MVRALLLAMALLALGADASAQSAPPTQPTAGAPAEGAPQGWAYELAEYLMSPWCPGRTIADCPSQQAKNTKMWMIVQEAAGRTREEVEAELIARYGEVMRPAPRAEGFGAAAYVFPLVAFAAGGVFVAFYLWRQTHGDAPGQPAAAPPASDPELERMLDDELSR